MQRPGWVLVVCCVSLLQLKAFGVLDIRAATDNLNNQVPLINESYSNESSLTVPTTGNSTFRKPVLPPSKVSLDLILSGITTKVKSMLQNNSVYAQCTFDEPLVKKFGILFIRYHGPRCGKSTVRIIFCS